MRIIRRKVELRAATEGWRRQGESIGAVLTMGALHEGHLSLVRAAKAQAERVIVTIFVNPRQFNNPADLAGYPRTEDSDAVLLGPLAVDVLYVPDPGEIYPDGFATTVSVAGPSAGLCGVSRPGHFDGMATVVTKLLMQTDADVSFFGEKDYQQLQVVRRLVTDLDMKTGIVPCPTLREADGLAMSSRNARLDAEGRAAAPAIHRAMAKAVAGIEAGVPVRDALDAARAEMRDAGLERIDYLELRSDPDLVPMDSADWPGRLFAAVFVGEVRLIDNLPVRAASSAR